MKISLILPYWDRQRAADVALILLGKTYADFDMEVVVIDDGNVIPFKSPDCGLNIKVVSLPIKHEPKCPSTAWNAGVAAASGDVVILSCIEVLHKVPVIEQMVEALTDIGEHGYVLAAAWCPEAEIWHCHSSVKVPRNPEGTGIAFCGAMHKSLYLKAGGFDEEYRDGAGYEDNDFINRVLSVGGRFFIRDDLVVTHPKTGATIEWGMAKFARNEMLYYSKWPIELRKPMTTFVCLNQGNYCGRGAEYVNNLFDMVRRNLSDNVEGRFVCLTDDPTGLHEDICAISLPDDIKGWWGKLYMFKRGLFPDMERMIYFDLDTLIVSNIDSIVSYSGDFAILRDFMNANTLAPGVMLWRAGACSEIWNEWEAQGRPEAPMGDLWWINSIKDKLPKVNILQDIMQDKFVSYKMQSTNAPPKGSSVVCFHGLPRPHDAGGWVTDVWKENGFGLAEIKIENNVNASVIQSNIRDSSLRDLRWLAVGDETIREVVIVGGAPSMANFVADIKNKKDQGAYIVAMNGAGHYLNEQGITPDAVVIIDARESNSKFIGQFNTHYYLASQCDKSVFDKASDKCTLFHIDIPNIGYFIPGDRPIQAVGGGSTVGLVSMSLMYALGFRSYHLYGYDSSYSNGIHHSYAQPENNTEQTVEAHACGEDFTCAPWMVVQVNQFQELLRQLAKMKCRVKVHGNGLLPTVFRAIYNELPTE